MHNNLVLIENETHFQCKFPVATLLSLLQIIVAIEHTVIALKNKEL